MSAAPTPPDEWYLPPPSRLRVAVCALIGLWGGEVTAIAIGAHRPAMFVLVVLTTVALVVLAVRNGSGTSIGISLPSRPSLRKGGGGVRAEGTPPLSVAEEIAKLGELQEAGLITEDEFAAQKAKLLDG